MSKRETKTEAIESALIAAGCNPDETSVSDFQHTLSAAGYAIAPIDADEGQCKAGKLASWDAVMNESDDVAAMSSIWSAMIAAAQENG